MTKSLGKREFSDSLPEKAIRIRTGEEDETSVRAMPEQQRLIKDFIQSRHALIDQGLNPGSGMHIIRNYTDLMDQFIRSLFYNAQFTEEIRATRDNTLALVALGSYGRQELCLGSDVDLMIIHQGKLSPEMHNIIVRILYPLWDAKLEVGHSILTVQECIRLALNDFRVLTAVMDGRFLLGSHSFYKLFEEAFRTRIYRERKSFLKEFLVYQKKRAEKFHTETYFVEPDIKEGPGGLRDIHFMTWMASLYFKCRELSQIKRFGVFTCFESDDIVDSAGFLLEIRNHLHALTGRKEDRLYISYQQKLSRSLGYEDSPHMMAAENFMRDLYFHLNRIHYGHEAFVSKVLEIIDPLPSEPIPDLFSSNFQVSKGAIAFKKGRLSEKDPIVILKALKEANRLGLFLDAEAIWESKKIIETHGQEIADSAEAVKLFLELILNPNNPKIIRLALEIGLMTLFIPEFNNIRNLPELGSYHVETVDLHSIRTLEILNEISKGSYAKRWPLFKEIFLELEQRDHIYLAALLHDIGKGYGEDHSKKGAELIPKVLKKLGVHGKAPEVIALLIQHHLMLAQVSQHRDLNDEKTCAQVALAIQNEDLLNMLFLLTVADSFATGPIARSDWKIMLLTELFFKVKRILKKGVLATPDANHEIERKKTFIKDKLAHRFPQDKILHLIDQVPITYFLNIAPEHMVRHFEMAMGMGDNKLQWDLEKLTLAPVTRIILCTYDKPGLFSQMVGVLTLNNIKVLSANIFALKNGMAFDVYEVSNPLDPYAEKEKWGKIYKEINLTLNNQFPLDDRLRRKEDAMMDLETYGKPHIREVRINNEDSDFFTIVEVRSTTIAGLLYKLAKNLFSLELDIRFAKFDSDEAYMSGDFYVRDLPGQKIYNEKRIKKIKDVIMGILQ